MNTNFDNSLSVSFSLSLSLCRRVQESLQRVAGCYLNLLPQIRHLYLAYCSSHPSAVCVLTDHRSAPRRTGEHSSWRLRGVGPNALWGAVAQEMEGDGMLVQSPALTGVEVSLSKTPYRQRFQTTHKAGTMLFLCECLHEWVKKTNNL